MCEKLIVFRLLFPYARQIVRHRRFSTRVRYTWRPSIWWRQVGESINVSSTMPRLRGQYNGWELTWVLNRVVHGSHSWAIFGSFSNSFSFLSIWQRNKQKGAKNGLQNDVKNVYREHPGMENLEKWWENAFFSPGTVPKRWKMIIFQFTFCKIEVRVPFWVPFCQKFPCLTRVLGPP